MRRHCPTCGRVDQRGARCDHDGALLVALEAPPPVGEVIGGRYRVIVELGRGGWGAVYRARHVDLPRDAAIKLLDRRDDADYRDRFLMEVKAVAACEHPNVVPIYDTGEDPDWGPWVAMRYLRGEDLAQFLVSGGTVSALLLRQLVRGVCAALGAAHEVGIIHRDVKPGNVFLEDEGDGVRVRLLDFGIARPLDAAAAGRLLEAPALPGEGDSFGSPDYMAPEQIRGAATDERTDVYALGLVLFTAVAAQRPFAYATAQELIDAQLHEPLPRLRSLPGLAWIPPGFDDLLAAMCAKRPEARPATPAEVQRRFERLWPAYRDAWANAHLSGGQPELAWGGPTLPSAPPVMEVGRAPRVSAPLSKVRPPTVVVVDDEPAILELVTALLADAGYRVERASSGTEALELLRDADTFDGAGVGALVVDLMMPGMDGAATIDGAREAGFSGPIVVLSAVRSKALQASLRARPGVTVMHKARQLGELPEALAARGVKPRG